MTTKFNIFNPLNGKVDAVNGTIGNIMVFGLNGTITDSGVPIGGGGGGQDKQPSAVPGNVAIWGSGADLGQTVDTGIKVDDSFPASTNVLWSSNKINGSFLPITGGTMIGPLNVQLPVLASEATTKAYVDAQIASGTPDATTLVKGKVQLAGDLTGTAALPTVANLAITSAKLANLTGPSELLGSSSASSSATNISLGSNLNMTGSVLDVDTTSLSSTFLPIAGGSMTGPLNVQAPTLPSSAVTKNYVDSAIASSTPDATTLIKGKVQLAGDLTGTAALPTVANLSITTSKMANLTGPSELLGSSSASSSATNISLGSNLNMTGSVLDVNTTSLSSLFLPLAGGTMSGNIVVPSGDLISIADPPILATTATNKAYVDAQIVSGTPDATTLIKGKVQLAGDLTGTAALPTVANLAITTSKMANLPSTSQLLGSSSASSSATNISLGSNMNMTGSVLDVNSNLTNINLSGTTTINGTITGTAVLPVSNGGTGTTTLTGYVKGNGTSPFTAITSIPVADVSGAVQSVNGVFPVSGNVSVILGSVATGDLASLPPVGPPQVTGNLYVVSGDATPTNDGRIFIYTTTPVDAWLEVSPNFAAFDARYLQLAGDTMAGNIIIPTTNFITLTDLPTLGTSAANKNYVDSVIASSTPDATTLIKGKVQLAGDLTGTAALPIVANLSITTSKMANLTATSRLLGSSSASSSVTNISLGSNLNMTGSVLDVNTTSLSSLFLPLTGGTMSGNIVVPTTTLISMTDAPALPTTLTNKAYVDAQIASGTPDATTLVKGKVQLAGDLTGTAALPTVANLAITTSKMANLTATSRLLGSSSASSSVTNITLGTFLSMTGSTLDATGFLPLTGGTMTGNIIVPTGDFIALIDAPLLPTTATNKAYVDSAIASGAPDATTLIKGKVQLAGDLTGTAALPTVANLAITTSKMANLTGTSRLLGSSSASSSVTNITLGTFLSMTGSTLDATGFLPLTGGAMAGNILMSTGETIDIVDAPILPTTATNKAYVDSAIALSTPDATTLVKGKVQLAGDLTGTAALPTVANLSITTSKMANLTGTSQLLGSSSASSAATNITLGTGLSMSGTTLNASANKIVATAVRALSSSTGAVGWQVSATRPCMVFYSVSISTTATIGGASSGDIFLEVASTNSAIPGDWIKQGNFGNAQTVTLAIILQSVQVNRGQLIAYVPAGYYVKLRTVINSGPVAFAYVSGIEVLE